MKWIAWLLVMPALLCADWKIVTRNGDSVSTEYLKKSLVRRDFSAAYTTVLDYEHRRQVNWRNDLRQYEMVEWPPEVRPDPSGPVMVIERKTTDTGERKKFFGRTAQHLVSHITRGDGPGTVIDGWYIDAPGLPNHKTGFAMITAIVDSGGERRGPPRLEWKQIGPEPNGLPVYQKTTPDITQPRGLHRRHEMVSEVTELWEGALPDQLFQTPNGYQRVTNLAPAPFRAASRTWAEAARESWRQLSDWFSDLLQ